MTNKNKEKEFFDRLADKLDELWPKGDKGRSKALTFNAWANIFFRELLSSKD